MSKKNVSLIYTYGLKNGGDMAINLGAIDVLLKLGYNVKLFSRYSKSNKHYDKSKEYLANIYPELNLYPSPFKLVRNSSNYNMCKNNIEGISTLLGLKKDKKFYENFLDSDLIIFNGGNLFRGESYADYKRLLALMFPLRVARKNNIPYIVFPQSASKINFLGKMLLNRNLKTAEQVWTRENISFDYLTEKFDLKNINKSIDLSFFTEKHEYAKIYYEKKYKQTISNNSKIKIAFTIRTQVVGDLGELDSDKTKDIINKIKRTISQYIDNPRFEILLVIQTIKDKNITSEIYSQFDKNNIYLIEEYDPLVLKEIYSNCDLLIGMRLHSIILALSSNTPAIGFFEESWGYKNPGLMEKFNLPYKFINDNFKDFVEEINLIFNNKSTYKKRISEIIKKEKIKFLNSINI